ncbi:hypothetical protein ACJX0J_013080, partial [Zea mays]
GTFQLIILKYTTSLFNGLLKQTGDIPFMEIWDNGIEINISEAGIHFASSFIGFFPTISYIKK